MAQTRIMEPTEPLSYTKEEFASRNKSNFAGDEGEDKRNKDKMGK